MHEARYVSLPSTNLKVEVVLPIPFCGGVLKACSRRICVLLCESLKRLHDDNQTAQHEICAKMFYVHHCSLWFICLSRWAGGSAMTPSAWPSTPREQCSFAKSARLLRGLPREIDHPVFVPGFAAVYGAVTLPMGRPLGDARPSEPRENVVPSLILPLAVKIDVAAFKSSAPDQEATRRRRVRPRVFPLRGLRIEGAETEALDGHSLIGSLEEFQGNAAIQDFACRQRTGSLAPGSIGQRKAAAGVPLAFEKIKLLCLRVRGFGNHITHADLIQENLTRI